MCGKISALTGILLLSIGHLAAIIIEEEKPPTGYGRYSRSDEEWKIFDALIDIAGKPAEDLLDFAKSHANSGLVDEAILLAAHYYHREGKYSDSIDICNTIMKDYPNSACAEIPKIRLARGVSQPFESKVNSHLRSHPNYSADEALLLKCKSLMALNKSLATINLLQDFVDSHPKGRWAKEDRELRMKIAGSLRRINRTDEEIFLSLGRIYLEQKNNESAEKVFSQAIKVFEYSHEEWRFARLLAQAQAGLGKKEAEIQTLEKLRDLINNRRGPIRFAAERTDGTIEQLNVIPDDITLPEVEKRLKELRGEKEANPQSTPPQQKKE